MEKILIIKSNANDFERFISEQIIKRGYEVAEPYSVPIKSMTNYQLMLFKTRIPQLYGQLIGGWKSQIKEYETVIIFDNALTIQLVRFIHSVNPKCRIIIWLWNRVVISKKLFAKYAQIFSFDEKHARENGYSFVNQFYFDDVLQKNRSKDKRTKVFYVGYDKKRKDILEQIADWLKTLGVEYEFLLKKDNNIAYNATSKICLLDKEIDYYEVIKRINDCTCLLELNINGQQGLTLRALEAIYGGKKLITNNTSITEFPFYSHKNVFILGIDNEEELVDFLDSEIAPINEDILSIYSFDNWIHQIVGD